jgi:hypothetical protein
MDWKITPIEHRGEKRIKVEFSNNFGLNQKIRSLAGAKWSASLKSWHVADTFENRLHLNLKEPILKIEENTFKSKTLSEETLTQIQH